jgi:aspartyl-tRNA synthetase
MNGASEDQRSIEATSLRDALCGSLNSANIGERVSLCGWVARRREHGEHLAFIDLRDYSGIVQCVVDGDHDLRAEYVIRVTGVVRARPEGTINDRIGTGEIELGDCEIELLASAEPPPFGLDDRSDVDEQIRLRYRFLDLRRPRLQRNLRVRAAVNRAIRTAMDAQGFVEVETPILWAPTPEGAREFAVPSRLHHGRFYVLPQSPQLAKQLLMVGGVDRYYQIARCMRDEDLRADRQFEFTQLDLEASFVTQDDVMGFVSQAVLDAAQEATGERPGAIATITWAESMDRFGSDKPDLRIEQELIDLSEAFEGSEVRAFSAPVVKALRIPGGATTTRSQLDTWTDRAKALGAKGLAWFRIISTDAGLGFDSPLDRFLSDAERAAMIESCEVAEGDLILCVADEWRIAAEVLGTLRSQILSLPVGQGPYRYVWITEFPLFDGLDSDGSPISAHHPFTMPHPEDVALMATDPLAVRSQAYDLVLNGWELGSGSVRIHRADVQREVFRALGISDEEAEHRFGFLLNAFRYGAPPHAGFAFGIDRLVAIFTGEENIREVIAFPKTQSGTDLMTGAPATISTTAIRDLGLVFTPPEP